MQIPPLRLALGAHIGQVLTPELACAIEVEAAKVAREKVLRLEHSMQPIAQAECPVRHYFAPGMYAREITIPKGVVLVGAIHKTNNLVVLSKGRLRMATTDGTQDIAAPYTMTCMAGAKNTALALEDSVWTNFFPTDETDVDRLVEILTESKACELLGGDRNPQLLANQSAQKLES